MDHLIDKTASCKLAAYLVLDPLVTGIQIGFTATDLEEWKIATHYLLQTLDLFSLKFNQEHQKVAAVWEVQNQIDLSIPRSVQFDQN